jgi:2-oxoglutarate dehydrogenase E1 component
MEIISRYPNVEDVNWVQEEPKNQGAWYAMQSRMRTGRAAP